ncbi:hypothetical protein [Trinickia soli]|uniref:Uncharacterized protein n=1 Tax=Trinickia soli TaxID=380675 RepID=A0A2N7VV49_9BURK|nr:hypothetical protein [Trinickia soli]KAA0089621.1 hypothetical protein CIW54_06265 [Paraburkholderia sp. T12-10]PMS21035.1 hypothetical protein C0Z19_19305 [Trinickia soli]CAB3666325.1 hypothetical protein LMG24076_01717 [Trinickia soli]
MSSIIVYELSPGTDLDRKVMSRTRGGANSWLAGLGPLANVNVSVGVAQNIEQNQAVVVNALNNNGVIGAGFGPLKLDVSPAQFASTGFAL